MTTQQNCEPFINNLPWKNQSQVTVKLLDFTILMNIKYFWVK